MQRIVKRIAAAVLFLAALAFGGLSGVLIVAALNLRWG